MGLEAAVAGALISAASSQVVASRQRSSQRRLAAARLDAERKLARKEATAQKLEIDQGRRASAKESKLAMAAAQGVRNRQLQTKGIAPKAMGSFGDITRSVLDEGTNV